MSSPTAIEIARHLSGYDVSAVEILYEDLVPASLTFTTPTVRVTFATALVGVYAGHGIQFSYGVNKGWHEINNVDASGLWVEFDSLTGSATNQGVVKILKLNTDYFESIRDDYTIPLIETIVGFPLTGAIEVTEIHDGSGGPEMLLNLASINSVTSIKNLRNTNASPGTQTVDIHESLGMLVATTGTENSGRWSFPSGVSNIQVVYNTGFAEVPEGKIKKAVELFSAAKILTEDQALDGSGDSLSIEGYSKSGPIEGGNIGQTNHLNNTALSFLNAYVLHTTGD